MKTVRIQAKDGSWKTVACVIESHEPTTISVPAMNGTWVISPEGMVANIGGNDWAIYTLNPADCRDLCKNGQGRRLRDENP